jgi:hypothetical protein
MFPGPVPLGQEAADPSRCRCVDTSDDSDDAGEWQGLDDWVHGDGDSGGKLVLLRLGQATVEVMAAHIGLGGAGRSYWAQRDGPWPGPLHWQPTKLKRHEPAIPTKCHGRIKLA